MKSQNNNMGLESIVGSSNAISRAADNTNIYQIFAGLKDVLNIYRTLKTTPELYKLFKEEFKSDPRLKAVAIPTDIAGLLTYLLPLVGEFGDIPYAPIQTGILTTTYGEDLMNSQKGVLGLLSLLEEGLPFTDLIPSGTIYHAVAAYNRAYGKFMKDNAVDANIAKKEQTGLEEPEDPYADAAKYSQTSQNVWNDAQKQNASPRKDDSQNTEIVREIDDEYPYNEMEHKYLIQLLIRENSEDRLKTDLSKNV